MKNLDKIHDINNFDPEADYPDFNIGTKDGNKLAGKRLVTRINQVCDDLDISIHPNGYFKPNNTDGVLYNFFKKQIRGLDKQTKIVYLDNLLKTLFELQKSRITIPSNHSKFNKYYFDTLFFTQNDYPLYKECTFEQVIKKGYAQACFVEGSKVMQDLVDSDDEIERGRESILDEYSFAQNDNNSLPPVTDIGAIISIYNEGDKEQKKSLSKVINLINKFLSTLQKELKTVCDMLSNPLVTKDKTKDKLSLSDLTELVEKFFHFAFCSLKKDLGINHSMKLKDFNEKDMDKILLPTMSVLNVKTKTWVKADVLIDYLLNILRTSDNVSTTAHTLVSNNLYNIVTSNPNTDLLMFSNYIMPFKNGNYNALTKTFNPNPNPFKEPVPQRFAVNLNREADYKNYDEFGTTPYDFITFPFKNGEYDGKEAEQRGIYAGLMIADILTPFSRDIGGDSIYWFVGAGGTGKTVYTEMLERVVGVGQSKSIEVADLDKDKFALGNINGKYLLVGNEASDTGSFGVRKLKQIATGDRTNFEEKYAQNVTCVPTCTVVITSNGNPMLKQDGGASERRFKIIKFNSVFQKESISNQYKSETAVKDNPLIKEKAIQDQAFLEAIVNYAVTMLEKHAVYSKEAVRFPIPKSIKDDTSESVKQNDTVAQFAEFLGNVLNTHKKMVVEGIYTIYKIFVKVIGKEKYEVSFEKFKNELARHENIVVLKNDKEFYTYKGENLRRTRKETRQGTMDKQRDIVNCIRGCNIGDYDYFIERESNNLNFKSEKAQTRQVVWLLPFNNIEDNTEKDLRTTKEVIEDAKENGENINENDLAF